MSNDAVGGLYRNVIEGVLSQAQPDFEDSGIDHDVIQELRKVWQERLSGMKVADMPWDPKQPAGGENKNGIVVPVGVKTEAKEESPSVAASAAASGMPVVPADGSVGDSSNSTNGNNGLVLPGGGIPQTDGADDDDNEVPLTREQIDTIIKNRADRIRNNKRTTINIVKEKDGQVLMIDQTDGNASDQSDSINSDLDDPEDELASGDEEDDDEQGQIMLCLYDKVQRVKNKWKYVLKDGIANINQKDYVFARGTGESEW